MKLVLRKAWENRNLDLFLPVAAGKGEGSFLEGKAAQGFIEVKVMESYQARQAKISFG
jgi:hypothetical protein